MRLENRSQFPLLKAKISFRLDSDRMLFLERFAASQGFKVSLIVRHLVCRFVEEQRRACPPPSFINSGGK